MSQMNCVRIRRTIPNLPNHGVRHGYEYEDTEENNTVIGLFFFQKIYISLIYFRIHFTPSLLSRDVWSLKKVNETKKAATFCNILLPLINWFLKRKLDDELLPHAVCFFSNLINML